MTDTGGETTVDEIVVTGQRARGPSPFGGMQWPTKGSGGSGSEEQLEDTGNPGTGQGVSDEERQCATPEGRRQWNADAKAREAIERFKAVALARYGEDLQNREFGALICEFSDGSIDLSPVSDGPPLLDENGNAIVYPNGRVSVGIPPGACVNGTPLGFVHSHPGPNAGFPSFADFDFAQYLVDYYGADAARVGVYTLATFQDALGQYQERVSRAPLADRNQSQSQNYQPQWINPEATVCPT